MTKTYNFYCDPGHAWMKVQRKELIELGLESKISSFSYMKGDNVYLEEDCDATKFIRALREKGIDVQFKESYSKGRSSIRNYLNYSN